MDKPHQAAENLVDGLLQRVRTADGAAAGEGSSTCAPKTSDGRVRDFVSGVLDRVRGVRTGKPSSWFRRSRVQDANVVPEPVTGPSTLPPEVRIQLAFGDSCVYAGRAQSVMSPPHGHLSPAAHWQDPSLLSSLQFTGDSGSPPHGHFSPAAHWQDPSLLSSLQFSGDSSSPPHGHFSSAAHWQDPSLLSSLQFTGDSGSAQGVRPPPHSYSGAARPEQDPSRLSLLQLTSDSGSAQGMVSPPHGHSSAARPGQDPSLMSSLQLTGDSGSAQGVMSPPHGHSSAARPGQDPSLLSSLQLTSDSGSAQGVMSPPHGHSSAARPGQDPTLLSSLQLAGDSSSAQSVMSPPQGHSNAAKQNPSLLSSLQWTGDSGSAQGLMSPPQPGQDPSLLSSLQLTGDSGSAQGVMSPPHSHSSAPRPGQDPSLISSLQLTGDSSSAQGVMPPPHGHSSAARPGQDPSPISSLQLTGDSGSAQGVMSPPHSHSSAARPVQDPSGSAQGVMSPPHDHSSAAGPGQDPTLLSSLQLTGDSGSAQGVMSPPRGLSGAARPEQDPSFLSSLQLTGDSASAQGVMSPPHSHSSAARPGQDPSLLSEETTLSAAQEQGILSPVPLQPDLDSTQEVLREVLLAAPNVAKETSVPAEALQAIQALQLQLQQQQLEKQQLLGDLQKAQQLLRQKDASVQAEPGLGSASACPGRNAALESGSGGAETCPLEKAEGMDKGRKGEETAETLESGASEGMPEVLCKPKDHESRHPAGLMTQNHQHCLVQPVTVPEAEKPEGIASSPAALREVERRAAETQRQLEVCLQTAGGVGLERKVRLQSPRPEVFVGEEKLAACRLLRSCLTNLLDPPEVLLKASAMVRLKAAVGEIYAVLCLQTKAKSFLAQRALHQLQRRRQLEPKKRPVTAGSVHRRHSLPGSLHDDLTARRRWSDRSAESPALRGPARPVPAPVPTAPVPPLALDLVQFGEPLPAEPAEPAVREEGGKEQLPEVPRGSAISAVRSATAKRRRPMSSPAVRGTSAKEMKGSCRKASRPDSTRCEYLPQAELLLIKQRAVASMLWPPMSDAARGRRPKTACARISKSHGTEPCKVDPQLVAAMVAKERALQQQMQSPAWPLAR
ncbi:unnamed protein product [Effrenium voratum]|uniref:Uncharacterized protein n=1 Tax=Effrenium voratum TaxID=2562239 RepID=A0AA36IXH5_9DINO|nr:unnamed protein product [Effrenium voratum]CAJ1439157.1 unnamed protein product [Effrenium voratum]